MNNTFKSKTATIRRSDEEIYALLTDFSQWTAIIPPGKVRAWKAEENKCSFEADMIGGVEVCVMEKKPFESVRMNIGTSLASNVFLDIQLQAESASETAVNLVLEADMSPMIKMMVGSQITSFLDNLMDKLSGI